MKYRSLYIVLFLLGGTTQHIFACEPENDEAREQKRIEIYKLLFEDTTNRIPKFVEGFFKGAIIAHTEENKCEFYWHPTKKTDPTKKEFDKFVWMNRYQKGYDIYFKELHKEALAEIVYQDQEAATKANVTLTLDPDNEEDLILEIAPILDNEDTE